MALLHHRSSECTKSELDLFAPPFTQLSVEDTTYVEVSPIAALTENGPVEFFIPGDGERYLDLSSVHLYLRLKITKGDGSDLADNDAVSVINYPIQTLFSQCDVRVGERLISQSSNTHPYRSILECLLNYSKATLETQFSAGLFSKDTAGHMDVTRMGGTNLGFNERGAVSAESREFELVGALHSDLFFSDRLLLNGVDVKIKLTRAKDQFCLMAPTNSDFKLNLLAASLFVKKVGVSPAVKIGHAAALQTSNALYPLSRVTIKTFSIPAGSRVCTQENLFLGHLPSYVVLGMVDHQAFTGAYHLNPFNFQHANCEYLTLSQDGRQIPAKPFQPQFGQDICAREFYNLYLASGRHMKDQSLIFTKNDFPHGYCLFLFNLTNDEENSGVLSPMNNGCLRLDMRFNQALPQTMTLVVYAAFDSILEINSRRQVLTDFY
ncbi:uncharacterized protein F54H12.2-like [Sardina pilchardus]|uniref:uncharacterized protein F54H12.2-like n=1 Tax=Sardina pilchardus TaxID=27697 RepID=UPI002E140474